MTRAQLGACIGASSQRVGHLLRGSGGVEILTLRELQRLGERLGVDGRTLLVVSDQPTPSAEQLSDATKLHAAMTRIQRQATRQQLAALFDWDLRRTSAALEALEVLLQGTGQTLHRVGSFSYGLRSRDSALTDQERKRADQVQLRRSGLDRRSASLLLRLAREGGHLSPRQSTHKRLGRGGALVKMGLVQNADDGGLQLHPDVSFSLGLEDGG